MLEVNGLFVDIKGQPILKGVDFSVKGGELMGLPSGLPAAARARC